MLTFIFIVRLVVWLVFSNSCKTLSYNPARKHADHPIRNIRLGDMAAFSDVGLVQIEVPEKHYIMKASGINVEGSFGELDLQLISSTQISGDANNSSDNVVDRKISNGFWDIPLESDAALKFFEKLQVLSLEMMQLHNISLNTFKWLSRANVQFLNMQSTDIKTVAEDTLEPMQSTVRVLDLASAQISLRDLNALMRGLRNDTIESPSSNLFVLSLARLNLRSVPYDALRQVRHSLMLLSLFGNDFRTVSTENAGINSSIDHEEDAYDSIYTPTTNYYSNLLKKTKIKMGSPWARFPKMPFLIELDLRHCNIDFIDQGSFENLGNLKTLEISGNNIIILRSFAFTGLRNLASLHISYNGFRMKDRHFGGMVLGKHTFTELYSLETLNLSFTTIHPISAPYLTGLPRSLIRLDLRDTKLSSLEDEIFRGLQNLQSLDLSDNFGLASDVSTTAFQGLDMLQELYMARTSLESLEALKHCSSLRVLDVKRNKMDQLGDVLKNFPLLEYLDVSFNYINSWQKMRAFGRNPKLKTVYLHSNSLSLMSQDMLEDFKSLSQLTLAHNNFVCNCHLNSFMEYLIAANNYTDQNLPILTDYSRNGTTHVCTDTSLTKTVPFADTNEYCVKDSTRYWLSILQHATYISVIVLICFTSIGGLFYWKWWYIRYVAVFIKNATVLSMINAENCNDRIYIYDIFVSYSDENRNWVFEELIPNLEGPETRFNICLHERDFQVGVGILENIITGMDQSRTILLIISGYFLKSQWCQFEMHMAQHRLLETCREELVLVLLEEIPRIKRTKILRYLMMVKTYIVWPKDSDDDAARKLFWKRLKRAITANKSKCTTVV